MSHALVLLLVLGLLVAACGARSAHCAETTAASVSAATSNSQGGRALAGDAAMTAPPPAMPPPGFVAARVEGVIPTAGGHALMLADLGRTRIVPVMIGEAEAMVIDLRVRGERFQRPLTHDLLDAMLRTLGGTVVMVQVDKLQSGVFIGSVFVWDGRRTHRIDARTSDAVAIALGHQVPIYVSTGVFEEAGIRPGGMLAP